MVLTRTDENELLTALYAGLLQEKPWRLFLARLRARTEADICRLFIRPAGEGEWRQADSVEGRSPDAGSFAPPPPAFEKLRAGRVYAGDEMGGGDSAGACKDMAPDVTEWARHVRVSLPEGGDLALSILRRKGDFRAREGSLLASLAPHLTIALRGRMELEMERRHTAMAGHALAGFSQGWLLLDGRRRVLDANPGAALILEEGRMARRAADGRLRLLFAEAETLLEAMTARQPVSDEPRAAWLSVNPPIQMLVARPPAMVSESLAAAQWLVVMRRMPVNAPADGRFLPGLFGLTRSEAALAGRIAGGASLAEAAKALGLTIETARNYSKRIYVKAGARGQADLVRIVLEGVRMPG